MKISKEAHEMKMKARRERYLAGETKLHKVFEKIAIETRVGGPPFNDGHDEERLERAKMKREWKGG